MRNRSALATTNPRTIAIVALLLTAYSMAYVENVTVGGVIVIASDDVIRADGSCDMTRTWFGEGYRFGGNLASVIFTPANLLDRKV